MKKLTQATEKTTLIRLIRRIARELGAKSVSGREFFRRSGVSEYKVAHLFGSYSGLAKAAGLDPPDFANGRVLKHTSEALQAEIVRVLRIPNSKLSARFFDNQSPLWARVCLYRFGSWLNALRAAADTLDPQRDADLLERIRAHVAKRIPRSRVVQPAADAWLPRPQAAGKDHVPLAATQCSPALAQRNLYGDLIRFRGLEHAPVNEQGVVLLFGMIGGELGYLVDAVKPGFPDCEAKRQIRPGIWQRVRIEFEFRSRSFRTHRHDPGQCDLIVCWEHNWPDCPVEVLELRSASQRLAHA